MKINSPVKQPGRAEMLELLRQRNAGGTRKDVQQTAVGRWPSCIINPTL